MALSFEGTGARQPRVRTVAVALATALGTYTTLGAPGLARAHVEAVTNCDDSGAGSLRDAVANAAAGTTVDFSSLACATITLTSGAIAVTQDTLTLNGPGAEALTIDANFGDRVLVHSNTGTLRIVGATIAHGKYASDLSAVGGCIASAGNVELISAVVTGCILEGDDTAFPVGGGVYAGGDLSLLGSRIVSNVVHSIGTADTLVRGAGGVAVGTISAKYSTVRDNHAFGDSLHASSAGGLLAAGGANIQYSTISDNYAQFFGGIMIMGGAASQIADSTISGNRAHRVSGIYVQGPLTISNSTIAFNRSDYGNAALFAQLGVELQSTIVAGNETMQSARPDDLSGGSGAVATGANNLIATSDIPVPGDTIADCPRLLPLDDNGGATRTHALRSDSPAIGFGNNAAGLDTDQRGADRMFGASTDIGAVEWNGDPGFAFRSGFEPVCDG